MQSYKSFGLKKSFSCESLNNFVTVNDILKLKDSNTCKNNTSKTIDSQNSGKNNLFGLFNYDNSDR